MYCKTGNVGLLVGLMDRQREPIEAPVSRRTAVEITEVRIKLMEEAGERLQAFCSITFDDAFVIRDLKIIEGSSGPFVAMPSRKLTAHCPGCGCKNHLRAAYCNQCGGRLKEDRSVKDEDGRAKLYADIAHPINSACREMIQERVIKEFQVELERAKLPGYVSSYDDFDHEDAAVAGSGSRKDAARARPFNGQTHVEPAEPQPRGPHKAPVHQTGGRAPSGKRDGFGAGIF
jgi:stage V sporulation protein G